MVESLKDFSTSESKSFPRTNEQRYTLYLDREERSMFPLELLVYRKNVILGYNKLFVTLECAGRYCICSFSCCVPGMTLDSGTLAATTQQG